MKELIRTHDYMKKNYIDIYSHDKKIFLSHWDENEFCETYEGELSNDELIILRDEINKILYSNNYISYEQLREENEMLKQKIVNQYDLFCNKRIITEKIEVKDKKYLRSDNSVYKRFSDEELCDIIYVNDDKINEFIKSGKIKISLWKYDE